MRDAAGHLPQRAQPLLLHHGLLCLAKVLIRLLQGRIHLCLVCSQCDVLAELPQELAVPAGESVRLPAACDQNSEDFAFKQEGRRDYAMQSAPE